MTNEMATFDTVGDENFGFISKLPVTKKYFDGLLRQHDPESTTILHMGQEFFPFWSVVQKRENGNLPVHYLFATHSKELPVLTFFLELEPTEKISAWLIALVQLIFTRQVKSKTVTRIERSQVCMEGSPPTTKFVRDVFKLLPSVGVVYFSVFPGRDPTVLLKSRLVSYVTGWLCPLIFLTFSTVEEFNTWVYEHRASLPLVDVALSHNLFLRTDASMDFMRNRFDVLKQQWPQDAFDLELLLGCLTVDSHNVNGASSERLPGVSSGMAQNVAFGSERCRRPAPKSINSRSLEAISEGDSDFEEGDDDF